MKTSLVNRHSASWPWSYGSWIYNYLCNQCLSPLILWVRISIRARSTTSCDKICQWFATSRWFSPGTPVSSTNKTDRNEINEILLKGALSTIKQTNKHFALFFNYCSANVKLTDWMFFNVFQHWYFFVFHFFNDSSSGSLIGFCQMLGDVAYYSIWYFNQMKK